MNRGRIPPTYRFIHNQYVEKTCVGFEVEHGRSVRQTPASIILHFEQECERMNANQLFVLSSPNANDTSVLLN